MTTLHVIENEVVSASTVAEKQRRVTKRDAARKSSVAGAPPDEMSPAAVTLMMPSSAAKLATCSTMPSLHMHAGVIAVSSQQCRDAYLMLLTSWLLCSLIP